MMQCNTLDYEAFVGPICLRYFLPLFLILGEKKRGKMGGPPQKGFGNINSK